MQTGTERGRVILSNNPKSLFGKDKLLQVVVYDSGYTLVRSQGELYIGFGDVAKVTAYNFFVANKSTQIGIYIAGEKKPLSFTLEADLYPESRESRLLLGAHKDYLLGQTFPENLRTLKIPLGFLGAEDAGIEDGEFRLGKNAFPFSDLEDFWLDKLTASIYLTLKNNKHKFMIKPEVATNILATLDILSAIKNSAD